MKFRYKKYSETITRPVIPIKIKYKESSINYEVLIDSGADICIFDTEIAEILGIDLKKGVKMSVTGITGKKEFYYLHTVNIIVGGWEHKANVGFLKNINKQGYGVVGQIGFFDKYSIKFDLKKGEIELRESIHRNSN